MTTGVIASPPILQFTLNNGLLAVNGSILTQVGGVNAATYADSGLTTPLPNPIPLNSRGEVSDAAGNSKQLFLTPNTVYTFTLFDGPNGTGNQIWQATYVNGVQISGETTAPLLAVVTDTPILASYARTAAEIAASVTPTNYAYPPGHIYRYGTNSVPGTTDMTSAMNAWASVGASLSIPVAETILISSTINLVSNTSITMVEGATIKCATANISLFKALSKSNIQIRGGTFQQTANGSTVHIGVIELNTCTNCLVDGVEIIGAQWHGILLSDSSNCTVRSNYIHNSLGTTLPNVDSCDISCYRASSFNVIEGNQCFGGTTAEHGIMIQDPGSSLIPLKNTVSNNKVGAHSSYGILNYLIDHANTWCQIIGNEVEGITGTGQSGTAGAGIYNQGAGGTVIANNTIRNCCISTTSNSLTPAGIGLNLDATMEAVSVVGNNIFDMANWYGIEVVNGPANIVGNTIRFSSVVSATNTNPIGIYVNAANNINVHGNFVSIDNSINPGVAIFVFANGVNISNISVTDNIANAFYQRGIRVDTTGAPTITNIVISGNNLTGGTANAIPLQVANLSLASITGNVTSATTLQALDVNACISTRIANNLFATTGTLAVNIAGTCTASYYDKSNTASTGIKNAATGMICEQLGSATPGAGFNSAVGDRIEQSVPVVGSPKGWRCTVAGNPGTWVSEGNL